MITSMMRRALLSGDGSTLNLDFTTGVLPSSLTFTRASTGTFINASGNVATASNDVARFDHDPTTGAPRGMLIEGTATNLQPYSADLSQTGTWSQQALAGVTANVSGIYDPANGTSASKIRSNSAASTSHLVYSTLATVSGTAYTMSAWVRAAEYNFAALHFASGANRYTVVFNLTTGAVTQTNSYGSPTGTGSNAVKFGDWWRLSLTMNAADTTSYPHICLSSTATPSVNSFGQPAFTGTAESGVYVWGAQVEAGSGAPSSYIPTGASTATRVADTAIIAAGSAFTSWYTGDTSGTFYADWHGGVRSTTGTNRTVLSTSDVVNRHFHMMQTAAAGNLRVSDFGASLSVTTANAMTSGARTKGAFSFNVGSVKLCLNGGTVASGSVVFTTAPTYLVIGGTSTNGTSITDANVLLNGCVRQIKYWPTILPDAQLQSLTT